MSSETTDGTLRHFALNMRVVMCAVRLLEGNPAIKTELASVHSTDLFLTCVQGFVTHAEQGSENPLGYTPTVNTSGQRSGFTSRPEGRLSQLASLVNFIHSFTQIPGYYLKSGLDHLFPHYFHFSVQQLLSL
jgi:hypothetical protein